MEIQPKRKKKYTVLWIVLGVLTILLALGVWYVHRMLLRPESFFDTTATAATPYIADATIAPLFVITTPEPAHEQTGDAKTDQTATQTVSPVPTEQPDTGVHRLNILLMGIDAYEDGTSTSGTMPHADATMVIAINFDAETVDLISLPRDTMTTAPGYCGYYKLNGVFNVGGGMNDTDAGFQLMCRLAEQWLGGILVPYYYAVDFQAVVNIVDAIGGVDYDVDQPFRAMNTDKYYGKGMHHLDGNAVMGYIRIRKGADGRDSSRTDRQRRMMVAIFKKLKDEGLLSQIPTLINAANSGIYTNTTLSQTTTLATMAMQIPSENIRTRSMYGTMHMQYDWAFCFVDQQNRIDLIREVFGIQAEPVGWCTTYYETWLHETGFLAIKYYRQAEKVLAFAAEQVDAGVTFTDEQIELYRACYTAYTALLDDFQNATDQLGALYTDPDVTGYERDDAEKAWQTMILADEKTLREAVTAFAESVGYSQTLRWTVSQSSWYEDKDINAVYVDFR